MNLEPPRFSIRCALCAMIVLLLVNLYAESQRQLCEVAMTNYRHLELILKQGVDIWEVDEKKAVVYLSPEERKWLTEHGFSLTPLPEVIAEPSLLDVDGYLTFAEYEADMSAWAAAYPAMVSLSSLGTSWEGRQLWMLKISDNVGIDEDEPEVLLIALQHAREWLAGMTLHGISEHFITQYGTDPTVTELVNTMELFIVLVANPDGYVYTHTTDRYWRKNRRNNGDGTFGVDLNRNWGWSWDTAPSDPSSGSYRGPAPFSEPETQALHSWILSRGNQLVGCLNYHCYGTRVMHNWAYTYQLPANVDVMGPLAREVAFAIEGVNGQRMRNGSWAITLAYVGGGSTIDYLHAELGIPTLTFELRPGDGASGGFAPPGSSIMPSVSENIAGALEFLGWIEDHANDAAPPTISDLVVTDISSDRATLKWNTDMPATRAVDYGTTDVNAYTHAPDKLRGISQSVTLTCLSPNTLYYARARSESIAGVAAVSEIKNFTTTATPQDITSPYYPAILSIRSIGSGNMELRWVDLEGSGVVGYRLYISSDGETWTQLVDENTLSFGMTSTILPAPPAFSVRAYYLTTVDNSPQRNESIPSDIYAYMAGAGATANQILIVDGYDRWNSKHIAQSRNHAFAADHGFAVADYTVPFDTCANQEVGTTIQLTDYDIVIWVLGDESTGNETFNASEQQAVKGFMDSGGNLFVSGSEIGWDLFALGSSADQDFYRDYLCADFLYDDMDDYDVYGSGGAGIFDTRLVRFDEGSRGIYRVDSPDVIAPRNGATAALRSPAGEICAIQCSGTYGSSAQPGRLVYLAFPFETIFPEEDRTAVMRDVLRFFGLAAHASPHWHLLY